MCWKEAFQFVELISAMTKYNEMLRGASLLEGGKWRIQMKNLKDPSTERTKW